MSRRFDICLVSPSHLASNPRLVKEADTLAAAGWHVAVVHGDHYPPVRPFDADLQRSRPWGAFPVNYEPAITNLVERALHKLLRRVLPHLSGSWISIAARAHQSCHARLTRTALATGASRFIGHTVAGLAAAGEAAARSGGAFGFDAEDFHPAETDAALNDAGLARSIAVLEQYWLPRATFVTAAAPLIAEAYAERYGLVPPTVLLNVFPRALAQAPPRPTQVDPTRPVRAYWFSQTLGTGRGLEEIIAILGRMATPVSLHLRGHSDPTIENHFRQRANAGPRPVALEFLPPAPADEMVKLAATYDVGLSLEQSTPLNRDLCLTNKIFTYLLAGLPVIATATRAQSRFAQMIPNAVCLINPDLPDDAAAALDRWFGATASFTHAAAVAWAFGQHPYNWDHEQAKLLHLLKSVGWRASDSNPPTSVPSP